MATIRIQHVYMDVVEARRVAQITGTIGQQRNEVRNRSFGLTSQVAQRSNDSPSQLRILEIEQPNELWNGTLAALHSLTKFEVELEE